MGGGGLSSPTVASTIRAGPRVPRAPSLRCLCVAVAECGPFRHRAPQSSRRLAAVLVRGARRGWRVTRPTPSEL
jgi:hypothetical protein